MKQYKTLLFDVDQTLFDFNSIQYQALKNTYTYAGIKFNQENYQLYLSISKILWSKLEKGELTNKELADLRFKKLIEALNHDCKLDLEAYYEEQLTKNIYFIEDAYEVCEALSENYELIIITNGIAYVQHKRLKKSQLDKFFKDIFISEEVGYQKPSINFFKHVLSHIDNVKNECLVIGDSLTSDIQGGINAGIDTCWFNPEYHSSNLPITYQISNLKALLSLLK